MAGVAATVLFASLVATGSALAAPACQNTGTFERWLEAFKKEAASQGIPRAAISLALDNVTFDPTSSVATAARRIQSKLSAILRPHDRRRALPERP
jgi:membrane-bound lytic murein transglycosylase B